MQVNYNEAAVLVRSACMTYDLRSKEPVMVMDQFNMTVRRGAIYGLLGASGCGKTSLLTCIVGIRNLQSGEIAVLGGKPGTSDSGTPGPRIGYMPQELALMTDLTSSNVIFYFGRLFGMSSHLIQDRLTYLTSLLDLTNVDLHILYLSGGEQRRVSLAVALLHDPELLVLDEPTVGLDPVLRQRTWDYLKEISEVDNKTVIITTHYIEEARQANVIGLMREGKLLAENSPSKVMEQFQTNSLEVAFLKLSCVQSNTDTAIVTSSTAQNYCDQPQSNDGNITKYKNAENFHIKKSKSVTRTSVYCKLKAKFRQNLIIYLTNSMFLVFLVTGPLLQMSLLFLTIGHTPHNMKIAVVNDEFSCNNSGLRNYLHGCNISVLSCTFISTFTSENLKLVKFKDQKTAISAVRAGKAFGFMHFRKNFSKGLTERYMQGINTSDLALEEMEIDVHLDMANGIIGLYLKNMLIDTFFQFAKHVLKECGLKERGNIQQPLKFEKPIYGSRNDSSTLFMFPGLLLSMIFFLGLGLTSTSIVTDIQQGTWNRDLVSGLSQAEILISHLFIEFLLLIAQVLVCFAVSFLVFGMQNEGSMWLVFTLSMLIGLCGVSYGTFISVVSDSIVTAIYFAVASFVPMNLLCGVVWPVEGMPQLLRLISAQIPITSVTLACRNVLTKGWGISHPSVYKSCLHSVIWIVGFLLLSLVLLCRKR